MRTHIKHSLNNPLRLTVKVIALAVAVLLFAHAAYASGVRHTIESARPYVDGPAIVIDFDGQLHEYY